MKTLAFLALALLCLIGPARALFLSGPVAAIGWFAQPLHLVALVVPLVLLRFQRQFGGSLKKLVRHHKANLAGPVPILVGTHALPGGMAAPRLGRRSRTWTILGVWVAAVLVVASYLTTGGGLVPTCALAAIAALYWMCPGWRLYSSLAAAAVFACAFALLVQGAPAGTMALFYASLVLAIARTRRSLGAALAVALVCEAFRIGVGTESLIVLAVVTLFHRQVSKGLDLAWAQVLTHVLAHLSPDPLPEAQEPWGLHEDPRHAN